MARKRKATVSRTGVFDVVSAVKSAARTHVGQPRPTRVESAVHSGRMPEGVAERGAARVRGVKHKKPIEELLREQE